MQKKKPLELTVFLAVNLSAPVHFSRPLKAKFITFLRDYIN
jgi:hypothetical protein